MKIRLNPLAPLMLPISFGLAFLPGMLELGPPAPPAAHSLAALGPAAAGFWLAAGLRDIRLGLVVPGMLMTALLWLANWLMLADGPGCCAAGH